MSHTEEPMGSGGHAAAQCHPHGLAAQQETPAFGVTFVQHCPWVPKGGL